MQRLHLTTDLISKIDEVEFLYTQDRMNAIRDFRGSIGEEDEMIIEIAAGIILAVACLVLWPLIVAGAIILVAIALVAGNLLLAGATGVVSGQWSWSSLLAPYPSPFLVAGRGRCSEIQASPTPTP